MTSDDTHALTEQLLKDNNYFGMLQGQITIMKQNKVRQ
jgi:UDP-N-acetylglucosamine pyrophosphorylase